MALQFLPTPTLRYLAIELTNVCNLQCSVCWSQNPQLYKPRKKGYMTDALYHQILTELEREWYPKEIVVGLNYGGESLLHPHFIEYLNAMAKFEPRHLQVITNGLNLTKKTMIALLNANAKVAVSLHKSKHLNQVIKKTMQLYHMKQQQNLSTVIHANIVAEEWSQKEIDHFAAVLHNHVDHVRITTYITEDMQTAMPHTQYWPMCPSMFAYLAVLWNGDTLPCCHILSSDTFTLGNLNEKSLKQVFKGKTYETLRYGETANTPCENCQVRR